MNTYTADLYIRKAMTVILTAAMFFLLFYSHNVSAAPSRIEVTGEYTMGDSDEKESAIAYARYYARQKAAMQAAAYVEAYNQEHDLGLDKLNVEIATARLIHEVEHNLRWQKTDAQDFHVIVKAVYEVNTDQLAEYVKPANAQYQEDYRINKAQLTGLEQEEARLREELRKNQNSEKAKELTQRLRLNGRMFMAIGYADEALQAANRGQLREGIAFYTKALNVLPSFFGGYCLRGELHSNLGEYAMAIEDFKRAIEINPAFKTAYFQRGNVYYVQGKYDLAIADFTKFLDLAMSDTDLELSGLKLAYGARSMAYREAGDFAKAVDDANMVIDLDREKNSGIGYYLRGMALAMGGDADKAMDDYEKAAQAKFTPDELHLLHEQIMKALRRA